MAAILSAADLARLRASHLNRRPGAPPADCGGCRVGQCEVPALLDAYAAFVQALGQIARIPCLSAMVGAGAPAAGCGCVACLARATLGGGG